MDTKGLLCVPTNTQLDTKCLPTRIFGKHINLGRNFHAKVPRKLQSESYTPKKVHITNLQNLRTCGIIFQLQKPRPLKTMSSVSRDLVLMDTSMDKNYEVISNTTTQRYSFTPFTHRQLITQVSTKDEPSTSSLEHDLNCNYISLYDANSKLIFEGSFDNGSGEQLAIRDGEHTNYRHPNDTSSTHSSTNEYRIISTTTYNINSSSTIEYDIDNIDNDNTLFDITCPRGKLRILDGVETRSGVLLHKLSDVIINSICPREDETIGLISARNIVHQQTDTGSNYIVNVVSTNNDNDNASNANANYNDTRSELSSEYGERIMMSNDSKYTSISVTIIVINTKHWRIDCIHSSYCTHNKSANYNDMCILSSIVDNSIYHLLVRYDWTRDTVVRFVVGPSTSISVCNVGTLYESEIVYDANNITANLRTDEDIDNCTYQDGEHRMSMHNTGFELALDSMTVTHNILSLDNVNTQRQCTG